MQLVQFIEVLKKAHDVFVLSNSLPIGGVVLSPEGKGCDVEINSVDVNALFCYEIVEKVDNPLHNFRVPEIQKSLPMRLFF